MSKMSNLKKGIVIFSSILVSLSLAGCNQSSSKDTSAKENQTATKKVTKNRKVKDMQGTTITLPENVHKVINLWPANNQVQMLLSGTKQLAGTTEINKSLPWATLVFPKLKNIPTYNAKSGGEIDPEAILEANPDVLISADETQIKTAKNADIPSAFVTFRDFDGLKQTVKKTGEILGGEAPKRAEEFVNYFDDNLDYVKKQLDGVTGKPKVYEIQGDNPLKTDGKISIATEWIEAAGGVNAMSDVTDKNMTEVTMEEVLKANPDVIILGTQSGEKIKTEIMNDPKWQTISAVANKQVYINPIGTFLWSRYSCEEALQVLWTAQILHPDQFKELDMNKKVQDFYKKFYNYKLTQAQAEKMLTGQNP